MEKFSELNYIKVYKDLKNNISFEFIATRDEVEFNDIEQKYKTTDLYHYFKRPVLNSPEELVKIVLQNSVGQNNLVPMEKIQILTVIYGGDMYYKKNDSNGDTWEVLILFPVKI